MDPSDDIYRLTGVSKTYRKSGREILAVRELDLAIRTGEWLAVQGKTGHGKTTLLQLLGGLDRPTRGRISFAGQDLATAPESRVRQVRASSFGFIFQTFQPGPHAHRPRERRGRADPARRASPPAARTGDGRPGQRGARRPGAAPARRAVRRPAAAGGHRPGPGQGARVLLADEPTGNLDEDTRDEIIGLLDTLWRERRLTLVLVSHDSSVVRRAQRIGVMSRGRLSIRQDTRT